MSLAKLLGDRFTPLALVLVLLHGTGQILWGERIPLTEGLGTYDGRRYGEIARDFHREVFEEGLDLFRLQRILPSAVIHGALAATGSSFETAAIVRAFLVMNLALQILVVLLWRGIARTVGLGSRGTWLGFALLFLNFANLKQPYFYPVLTDTPALALGAAALYFHLRGWPAALWAILLMAAFTWPALSLSGSLLFVMDLRPVEGPPPPALPRGSIAFLAGATFPLMHLGLLGLGDTRPLVWIALAILAAYAAGVAWCLMGSRRLLKWCTYAEGVRVSRLLLVIGILVALRIALSLAATAPGMTAGRHVRHLFLYNSGQPALFLLAHAVYFGPVVLVLLRLWPVVPGVLHRLGLGMTAYAAVHLAHAINTETRQLVDALPLYALVAALAAETRRVKTWHVGAIATIGLVASKVWLPINQATWGASDALPAQLYFMNMGPSMTAKSVAIQAAAAVLALAVVWTVLPRRSIAPAPPADGATS